ncbi:unnamed protein product [Rhizoctonia solani]|uniref:protein-L-isoaspartate(D-aspartate) O-methyltransferase n=1 Tax=Rhizoctonia solani TaxID=456999 RepID=A0A8H2XXT0_9AGAM|nr:unnamed protein product [Rhizoctonia solani]
MAWACSGKTNIELVNNMLNAGLFKSELVGEHAHATEYLLPLLKPGAKVLDVGSGSGYTCAIFHHLVNPTGSEGGKVVGIDHISELVDWSIENLRRDGLGAHIESGAIKMICGDGRLGKSQLETRRSRIEPIYYAELTGHHHNLGVTDRVPSSWPLQCDSRGSCSTHNASAAHRPACEARKDVYTR